MRCLALIVTCNRKGKLVTCLDAIRRQTVACDALVVDNASTDGTEEAVRSFSGLNVIYSNTGGNLGGAGGFAFGMRRALELGYEGLWLMDDDVRPDPHALENLLAAANRRQGEFGWLSSRCLLPGGTVCPMNLQRSSPFSAINPGDLDGNDPVRVRMASFVSLFLTTETVRRFGLPISEFFIWSDDLEYTRRISRDLPCYAIPRSTVVHDIAGSAASNVAVDIPERISRYFYAFRNEFFVYRREGLRGIAYYLAKVGYNLLRIVLKSQDRRLARTKAVLSGFLAGLVFRPAIPCLIR